MRDIATQIRIERVIAYAAYSNASPPAEDVEIDRKGFESLAFVFDFGTFGNTVWDFSIEGSDDGTTWTELSYDLGHLSAEPPIFEDDGGSPAVAVLAETIVKIGVFANRRYYRVNPAQGGVTAGGSGSKFGVYAVLGHPAATPV